MDILNEMLRLVALLAVIFFAWLCFVVLWRIERNERKRTIELAKASDVIATTSELLGGHLAKINKDKVRAAVKERKEKAHATGDNRQADGQGRPDDIILTP